MTRGSIEADADGTSWHSGVPTHLTPRDFQVLFQQVHGMWSGHIARSLIVLTCQGQNKPEDQAEVRAPSPKGLAAGVAIKTQPSLGFQPACSPGLWNLSASPRSCSIRDRAWLAASPAMSRPRKTQPLHPTTMSSSQVTAHSPQNQAGPRHSQSMNRTEPSRPCLPQPQR